MSIQNDTLKIILSRHCNVLNEVEKANSFFKHAQEKMSQDQSAPIRDTAIAWVVSAIRANQVALKSTNSLLELIKESNKTSIWSSPESVSEKHMWIVIERMGDDLLQLNQNHSRLTIFC